MPLAATESQQNLYKLMAERIHAGLKRQSTTTCSRWALNYRIMGQPFPGPWRFDHHPWTMEMHDATEPLIVGMKSAQMGFTEVCLNKTFFSIDVHGYSVLYILPALNPDASNFSTSRFDPALEMSPYLSNLFSNVKNVGHKRAGNANLFIRGSRSRANLKSLPVARLIFDEVDEMVQQNIPLAMERQSGHEEKWVDMISTPTVDGMGIHVYYHESTQDHFFFRCPSCNKYIELSYPDSLVITADSLQDPRLDDTHLICTSCSKVLDHSAKSEWLTLDNCKWIPTYEGRASRGFHINQMYSFTVSPKELAVSYLKGQINPADEQEFYNSKMGIPHVAQGARIMETDIQNCIGSYISPDSVEDSGLITIGIDVGKWLHYEIAQWHFPNGNVANDLSLSAIPRVLKAGKVLDFEDLDDLLIDYRVVFGVIDAHPEKRKALEFAKRYEGRIKLCYYTRGVSGRSITTHAEEEYTISVDRSSWMDAALSRFHAERIILPRDISQEYRDHLQAVVKIYEHDADGNPVAKFVVGQNVPDHFAHARTYCELALQFAASLSSSESITGVY